MSEIGDAGRTALVTGATGRFGSAISRRLVADGARTALLARNARHLERLERQLGAPGRTVRIRADVTEAFDLVEARNTIRERLGTDPDLLVMAAGVLRAAPFRTAVPAEWNAMIRTNLSGALVTAQTFMDGLITAGAAGRPADLVLIGSASAPEQPRSHAVFASLAAAVDQFAARLRQELGPRGVRVHRVSPQLAATDSPAGEGPSEDTAPERTADLVAFMAALPRRTNLAEISIRTTGG